MAISGDRAVWWKELLLGTVTGATYGVVCIIVGHPFDTIKTKMHAEEGFTKERALPTLYRSIKQHGFFSLYRGSLPTFVGSTLMRTNIFALLEAIYTLGEVNPWMKEKYLNLELRGWIAGFFIGTTRTIIENPFEYLKVNRQTYHDWTVRNLYTGITYTWIRAVSVMISYLYVLDISKERGYMDHKFGQFLTSGFGASLGYWVIWPAEIFKNQIQANTKGTGENLRERVKFLRESQGNLWFFRGIVPGTLSIFLRNGAAMIVMQWQHRLFTKWGLRDK